MAPTPTTLSTPNASTTTPGQATSSATTLTIPLAPPEGSIYAGFKTDNWSPSAIIGIVSAIVILCLAVPLIALVLRRYQKKRLRETISKSGSSRASINSVQEDQSLKSILVTRELQRSSLRVVDGVGKPEKALMAERGWNRTEVRGGDWR